MDKKCINPDGLFNSTQYGFSQVVIARGSKTVYISGQVGWDNKENIISKNDLAKQTDKAFENLKCAVESADGTMSDFVSLRIYIKHDYMNKTKPVSENLKKYFPTDPPVTTWIGVQSLADKDFLIEIDGIAVLD